MRTMGVLGLAGGVLALATALLPPAAEGSERLIIAVGTASAAVGGFLLARMPALGERGLAVLSAYGTILITIATREGGLSGGAGDNEVLYLWVILYSFYFLSLPGALVQTAIVGAAYGWVLTGQPGADVTQWLVTMSSLTVAGFVIGELRAGVYRRVDELSDRASRDGLTGLLNRRSLDERFELERDRAQHEGSPLSVLALDVDEFKALNDTSGHPMGDRALRQVAAALGHWTRKLDASARMGGDEFAVILPGAGPAAALGVAEDLRSAVSRSLLADGVRVTVSIGVTTADGEIPPLGELWQAADAGMYEAKRAGGDKVVFRDAGATPALEPLPALPLTPQAAEA